MSVSDSARLWALLKQQNGRNTEDAGRKNQRTDNMICLAAEVHDRIDRGQLDNFADIVKELESRIATRAQKDRENRPPTRYVE
jgi:hypothetical protein